MATENLGFVKSYSAEEDLSNDAFRFAVITSDKTARRPDSENEACAGIFQNGPSAGEAADICFDGISKLEVSEAVEIGDFVGPEYVSATDAGKGKKCNFLSARAIVVEAADAEGDLAGVRLIGPFPPALGTLISKTTVTTLATAGAATYTAAQLLGGLILRDPAGSARSDVTPTAAQIIAAITQAGVGNSFEFTIRNTADASEVITVTAGTDVTLSGTMTIGQNNSKRFLALVTSGTEVTIYSLGTVVH